MRSCDSPPYQYGRNILPLRMEKRKGQANLTEHAITKDRGHREMRYTILSVRVCSSTALQAESNLSSFRLISRLFVFALPRIRVRTRTEPHFPLKGLLCASAHGTSAPTTKQLCAKKSVNEHQRWQAFDSPCCFHFVQPSTFIR